ncbi:MAG: hypothetical protein ACI4JM_05265 [Oscillospiraceae bacterium]
MTEEQKKKIEFLNRAYYIKKKIDALNEVRKRNRLNTSVNYKSDGTQHKGGYNREEMRMMKILELDEKISAETDKLNKTLNEIYDVISTVDDMELNTLLTYRCFLFFTIDEIAEKMHYDEKTIRRKLIKALDKIAL